LQIVEHNHEWSVIADIREELEDCVKKVEGDGRAWLFGIQQPGQGVAAVPAHSVPIVIAQIEAQGPKDLHPRPQPRRPGAVPTGSAGRPRSLATGQVEDFGRQPGFANTGLAGNEYQPAQALKRLIEGPGQPAYRLLAPNEGRFAHGLDYRGPGLAGREF
jgi:hypothetical protein